MHIIEKNIVFKSFHNFENAFNFFLYFAQYLSYANKYVKIFGSKFESRNERNTLNL